MSKPSEPRCSYRKPDDLALLAELRPIINDRPTYGYPRVTALLNREGRKEGKPAVNAKRVLRVMQQNGLTCRSILRCGPRALMTVSLCLYDPTSAGVRII